MTTIFAVSLAFLALVGVNGMRRISVADEQYRDICPNFRDQKKSVALVPVKDPCDLKHYVSCFHGRPVVEMSCPPGIPYFDGATEQCVTTMDLPSQCQPMVEPTTCAEGADFEANTTTCRWYISCNSGNPAAMPCQAGHYFITNRCQPYTLHYAKDIKDVDRLKECINLDKTNPPPVLRNNRN